jgi:phage repressor protein C with HTH and peptisase S24 domain
MNTRILRQLPLGETGALKSCPQLFDSVSNHDGHKSISQYVFQEKKHISMCNGQFIRRPMEKTPDEKREILRKFINDNGLKIARWCKSSGVDKNSLYNFLNGHSQSLDLRTYAKLARTAEVPVWKLSGDKPETPSPTSIWVSGDVQAGSFREAVAWDESQWYPVDVPVPDRFRGLAKALEVRGTSMNVDYPEGSIAIWVDMLDSRPPRAGDDVVVYSICHDDLIEATIKEYRIDGDGKLWLWPRSHDPLHQAPVDIDAPDERIREIVIKGLVIGSYRPRLH